MDFSESYDCLIHSYGATMKAPPVARAYNGLVVATKHERSFEVVFFASTVGVI